MVSHGLGIITWVGICPGTSWSDWPMDDDEPGMSRSCWVMDDDDGPERSWSGLVMSTFAIFALFG